MELTNGNAVQYFINVLMNFRRSIWIMVVSIIVTLWIIQMSLAERAINDPAIINRRKVSLLHTPGMMIPDLEWRKRDFTLELNDENLANVKDRSRLPNTKRNSKTKANSTEFKNRTILVKLVETTFSLFPCWKLFVQKRSFFFRASSSCSFDFRLFRFSGFFPFTADTRWFSTKFAFYYNFFSFAKFQTLFFSMHIQCGIWVHIKRLNNLDCLWHSWNANDRNRIQRRWFYTINFLVDNRLALNGPKVDLHAIISFSFLYGLLVDMQNLFSPVFSFSWKYN